jgi:hypothetical protein
MVTKLLLVSVAYPGFNCGGDVLTNEFRKV